jgi:hypothetical protein
MADLPISRQYSVDQNGRDVVTFSVRIPEALAPDDPMPGFTSATFTLDYLAITALDDARVAKAQARHQTLNRTPWNPQTNFDINLWPQLRPATAGPGASQGQSNYYMGLLTATGEQRHFVGTVKARFDWTDTSGAPQNAEVEFQAGNPTNNAQTIQLSDSAPQLADLIQTATPPSMVSGGTTIADRVVEVINGVFGRLSSGLADAWVSGGAPTKDGRSYLEVPLDDLQAPEELEECWAQHISQLLVGSNYAGPGGAYGLADDSDVFRKVADTTDPGAPLCFACQHLTTMACITRGLDDAALQPLDAGSAARMASYQRGAASVGRTIDTSVQDNRAAATALANGVLVPGMCYVVENFRHIAFVLRALKSSSVQLLDTGAMTGTPGHSSPLTPGSGFNYDTSPQTRITRTIKQIGVPPMAGALRSAIERMRRTRPLALGRLVLVRRNTSASDDMRTRLLYASPMIPLWNPSIPTENYNTPLLCWSLREQAHRDEIEAWWLVDVPCRKPLRDKVFASRDFSWGPEYSQSEALFPRQESLCMADIASTRGGGFRWIGSLVDTLDGGLSTVKWRHENGTVTPAWTQARRNSVLETLPIGAVNAAPPSAPSTGSSGMPDNFVLSPQFPNRVVFLHALYASFPQAFLPTP